MTLLMHGGVDAAGARLDLRTDPLSGTVTGAADRLAPIAGDERLDCSGMVVLPAPAEPHAHLDKALSADAVTNPGGDLAGAILTWHAHRVTLDAEEIVVRARAAVYEMVAHGTTAIRSHADVGPGIGMQAVHALAALREELRDQGLAALEVVALAGVPVTGADGEEQRALLRQAMHEGADVVGGCPHLDPDPDAAARDLVALARELGRPIDLHTDETLAPGACGLAHLAGLVHDSGFPHGATASHCVSLGMQPAGAQRATARDVAAAGVAVVTLPQTNLFLQARGSTVAAPRGLTAVRPLLDAGACVAAGADNVRDPFNPMGRCDALETAALLVMAAHLTPEEAWHAVSGAARQAMGLPAVALAAETPAELLAVRGVSLADALARGSEHRFAVHAGRLVSSTHVTSALYPSPARDPVLT